MRLGGDEHAHLTRDRVSTLCGQDVPSWATWPTAYDGRRDCRDCRRLAREQGLTIEARQ